MARRVLALALAVRAAALSTPAAPIKAPLARAATFWRYASPVVARYLGDQASVALKERVLGQCLSDEECEVIWNDSHETGAAAARRVVDDLGGFYVKTGQIIASRQDLFPRQYVSRRG